MCCEWFHTRHELPGNARRGKGRPAETDTVTQLVGIGHNSYQPGMAGLRDTYQLIFSKHSRLAL